jgi:hypothetical protein
MNGFGAAAVLSCLSVSDAMVIGTTSDVIPMTLVTTPDIVTAQDLKGKTFGVSRFGSPTDFGLKKALAELGLDPNKDIRMIQAGGGPEIAVHAARSDQRMVDLFAHSEEGRRARLQEGRVIKELYSAVNRCSGSKPFSLFLSVNRLEVGNHSLARIRQF